VEEGKWYQRPDFKEDLYSAVTHLFRNHGMQVAKGSSVMPVLEGKCVGGSTVLNGAIIHRFDEAIYSDWAGKITNLSSDIPFASLDAHAVAIESELGIKRNLGALLHSLPVSHTLKRLGWEHQAMLRNAPGCHATGRCLQGCPSGGKWSMETTFVPRAIRAGAELFSETKAKRVAMSGKTATGVEVVDAERRTNTLLAKKGVIVATGVVQTPLLLSRSGIRNVHLGKHFQTHLGVGIVGLMPRSVREMEGPPQGIEITGFKADGYKLATQLVPLELVLSRTPLAGSDLVEALKNVDYYSSWMASIRSDSEGSVSPSIFGGPSIKFEPTRKDLEVTRAALHKLAVLMFEMGASEVYPGVGGTAAQVLKSMDDTQKILEVPLDPKLFWLSAGHLFGTARMGNSEKDSVVDTGFQVHGTKGLYIVDASVFPTNLGVNPQ
ncbi:MAG: GMC family oxidoreductase, partial [Verrucomicrobiales bacterium]